MAAEPSSTPWLGRGPRQALFIWAALTLVFWLCITRLMELAPKQILGPALAAVFLAAPLGLTIWAIVRAVRRQCRWFAAPTILATACTVVVAGAPLYLASIRLNFWAHRPAYEAVIADAKAGRLPVSGPAPWRLRHGVRYITPSGGPDEIAFPWWLDFDIGEGVIYEQSGCSESYDHPVELKPSPPAPPRADDDLPPVMQHKGRLGRQTPLAEHFCHWSIP